MENWQREQNILSEHYGMTFPESFFRFWEFMEALSKHGLSIQESPLEIRPGPVFEVFDKNLDIKKFNPILESRYYNDPPEFFTLLGGNTDGLHWGYYIDDPSHPAFIVAACYHSDACSFSIKGDNLFEAMREYLEKTSECTREYLHSDPANHNYYEEQLFKLAKIEGVLKRYETDNTSTRGISPAREITALTHSGIGIVAKGALYKETPELTRLLSCERFSDKEVQQLLLLAKDSIEAGYFGTALRIGHELWFYRSRFDEVSELLDSVYKKLDRPVLQKALKCARVFRERADKG